MADFIAYKGYRGTIEYSADDMMLVGSVVGIRDSLNYHGHSVEEITQSFHDSIDGYLEMCEALGRSPDKEYKGSFNVRVAPELHRKAAIEAQKKGISLNQYVQEALEARLNPDSNRGPVYIFMDTESIQALKEGKSDYNSGRYKSETAKTFSIKGVS